MRELESGKFGWIQLIHGEVTIAGERLSAGDAIAFAEEGSFTVRAEANAELLLFVLD